MAAYVPNQAFCLAVLAFMATCYVSLLGAPLGSLAALSVLVAGLAPRVSRWRARALVRAA